MVYLLGDFNINLLNADRHVLTSEFLENCYATSLFPRITKPTRLCDNTATLIDNIFASITHKEYSINGLFATDISDHFPIFSIEVRSKVIPKANNLTFRNYSSRNIDKFINEMRNIDWTSVTEKQDCQTAYSTFHSIFTRLYDKSFPMKQTCSQYLSRSPWLTVALKESIKIKNKLFIKMKKCPSESNVNRYKRYRALLNKLLRQSERNYYANKIEMNKNNMRKSWEIIKTIINQKKQNQLPIQFNKQSD
jgi:hypothetical protein